MFAASKTGAPVTAKDPKFNYVTMLLHGDGTNGAQNNTFLDSSTNNFTITRNGNTTQGTFSPYGSNWSNYFNGSSSYMTVPANAAFGFGTGDFTIEAWTYMTEARSSATSGYVFDMRFGSGDLSVLWLEAGTAYTVYINGATSSGTAPSSYLNTWVHWAVVRSSGTVKVYINGTQNLSFAASGSIATSGMAIGARYAGTEFFPGYISNFRVVKGTAVYTSTFTPSTAPLTAITNTSLLTAQSNRFIDNSTNAFAITSNGSPSVQRFSPFSPTSAYSTSVIGGSAYFDGTGDYLNTTSTQVIPSGSFTVEAWVYPTSSADSYFVAQGTTGNVGRFSIGITSGSWYVQIGATNINTSTVVLNQWTYVAATFNGTTLTLYVNGTSVGTGATVINAQNTTLRVGSLGPADWGTFYWTGYIGPVRISNTVRTISAPTTPYSSDGNTTCLLSYTNAGILDNAEMNDLETVGNAQISTSVKKYGTGSMYFDGTGDYLYSPSSPNTSFGTGDFTIEFWMYSNNVSGASQLGMIQMSDTAGGLKASYLTQLCINQGQTASGSALNGAIVANINNTNVGSTTAVLTTGTWYHIALVRSSGTVNLYVNGTSVGSATITSAINGPYIVVGGYYSSSFLYNGYLDDLRITKGYARYTSNFTPPTAAFPNN